ncbi:hypothetical protein GCM10011611_31630 [Aliidongia dinghuensis]|uniref:Transmembrane protein n=1 Tax=Aliidongia dinghuensis TaxID=1867774 RepID=A0A8J2YUD4_9PROT|nr:hypothetical protein [Aliidongia dinghuensis]GGF23194.1 hypothetical protein GCM10011611_31630 [Aliidongia dinghuensis]
MPLLARLRDLLLHLLTPFAAALFLLEDLLIRRLGRLLGRLAALPPVARAEAWAAGLPPYGALALFLVPSMLILPEKLLIILFLHRHHYWLALATLVGAKLFATAAIGRILSVCHPSLSQLAWFRRADQWVRTTRDRIHDAIRRTAIWRAGERLKRRVAAWNPFAELRGRLRGGRPL